MKDYIVAYEICVDDGAGGTATEMVTRLVIRAQNKTEAETQAKKLCRKVLGEYRETERENASEAEDDDIAITVTPVHVFVDRLAQRRVEVERWVPARFRDRIAS